MNSCKGICEKYKVKSMGGKVKYANGVKRCPICSLFIIYSDIRCPCCRVKLRITPKGSKIKEKFRIKTNIARH